MIESSCHRRLSLSTQVTTGSHFTTYGYHRLSPLSGVLKLHELYCLRDTIDSVISIDSYEDKFLELMSLTSNY